jgi:Zn-dependent protease/CBS domain-containing protein
MRLGVYKIATIGGIQIKVHWSWVLVVLLVTFDVAVGWYPPRLPQESTFTYFALGFVSAILLFVSVLLHELSHSFMALARKIKVRDITLYIFGGASNIEEEPRRASDEFLIAIVGPMTSLALGIIFWLLADLVTPPSRRVGAYAASTFEYMAVINILLAIFNLIPGFPLDGGRVLRSIIWAINRNYDTATRIAGVVGQLVAYGFMFYGLFEAFAQDNLGGGLWLAFIGWFLLNAAEQSMVGAKMRGAVHGITVGEVMQPSPATAAPSYTIAHLLSQFFLPRNLSAIPVVQDSRLVGLVTLIDIKDIPQDQWGTVTAGDVMVAGERLQVAHPRDKLEQAMQLLASSDIDQLPVVDNNGTLVGILTHAHLVRWLQLKEQLQRRGFGPVAQDR